MNTALQSKKFYQTWWFWTIVFWPYALFKFGIPTWKIHWGSASKRKRVSMLAGLIMFVIIFVYAVATSDGGKRGGASVSNIKGLVLNSPSEIAVNIGVQGVGKCIAVTTAVSALYARNPNIESRHPLIIQNEIVQKFFGDTRKALIGNNPAYGGALDDIVRSNGQRILSMVNASGTNSLLSEISECERYAFSSNSCKPAIGDCGK